MPGSLVVDEDRGEIWAGDRRVLLLPRELRLLVYLSRNQGLVLSRNQILDHVWAGEFPGERTVDDHVYRLRKKLEPHVPGRIIYTFRGIGYMFKHQVSPEATVLRNLEGDRVQDAYLAMIRSAAVRGAGRHLLSLVLDPPPGCAPGDDEMILTAWLTGDLEGLADFSDRLGGKALVLAGMVAEDLFGIRVALGLLDDAFPATGFTADARILRGICLVNSGALDDAGAELARARREIDEMGTPVLLPGLMRAEAVLAVGRGFVDKARGHITAGLDMAERLGAVREQAWLTFLRAWPADDAGHRGALDLLHRNRLGTDYLVMSRRLAQNGGYWSRAFRTLAHAYDLPGLAKRYREMFTPLIIS